MRVVMIGSQTFPVVQCAIEIASFIKKFPPETVIITRGSKGFDIFAQECAKIMNYKTEALPGKGGGFNFERDAALVESADRIYAFFDPEHIGTGGTQHVIDKALDQRKPVYSYTAHGRDLILVGSDDGAGVSGEPGEGPGEPPKVARQAAPQRDEPKRGSEPQGRRGQEERSFDERRSVPGRYPDR